MTERGSNQIDASQAPRRVVADLAVTLRRISSAICPR
jgi:hypothetical protein